MPTNLPIPAAQYLRMSTEHQQYSLTNQAVAIKEYAERNGFAIIQTYEDAGKSGLVLKRRAGLRNLLNDVVNGNASYRAIFVYDVSRWGRFQDTDEAAHYEFLCKSTGVPVHYCAEQFLNDGTVPSTILKALKRTMAGEYSRELGVKVFEGMKRLVQLGFRMGGPPGYGLHRMLVSADSKRKQKLSRGEYKSISNDRILLVPGPRSEVELVREMYGMVLKGKRPMWIVRELNRRGVVSSTGGPWDVYAVIRVLTNPKYTGCNAWGMTSQKLRSPAKRVPADEWTIKPNAFAPIIDQQTFERVQATLRNKTIYKSNEQLLTRLADDVRKGDIADSRAQRCVRRPSCRRAGR